MWRKIVLSYHGIFSFDQTCHCSGVSVLVVALMTFLSQGDVSKTLVLKFLDMRNATWRIFVFLITGRTPQNVRFCKHSS